MSWIDRLRKTIQLTSPGGSEFTALWQGNSRSIEKKLGVFQFPKVRGAVVQDLDVGPVRYPLTIFFQGEDNDLEANRFLDACKENGRWLVLHPVHGLLDLQLVSATEQALPVESGNLTQFDTVWLEPVSEVQRTSTVQIKGQISNQINVVNGSSADQLLANVSQDTAGEVSAFQNSVNNVVAAVENTLENVSDLSAEITARMISIKRGISAVLDVVPMDIISLAGQVQQLIQLPALAIADVEARLDTYGNFADQIFGQDSGPVNLEGKNIIAVKELALVSAIGAVAGISSTGALNSRLQAIEVIEVNAALLNDTIDHLDESQSAFETVPIDVQYFSQSESFPSVAGLTALAIAFLLRSIFNLAIEKRFILPVQKSPIRITIEEYGSLGDGDVNFDFFIATNQLQDLEIIMLEAGREVVVYV